jgi:hypothetical protein
MDARNPAAEGEFHATPVVGVIDALWFISQKAMLGRVAGAVDETGFWNVTPRSIND